MVYFSPECSRSHPATKPRIQGAWGESGECVVWSTVQLEEAENQEKYKLDAAAMEKALKMKIDTIQSMEKQIAEMGVTLEDKQARTTPAPL